LASAKEKRSRAAKLSVVSKPRKQTVKGTRSRKPKKETE
jgi:hypothetical protein